jgi:hypothetical protein
MSTSKPHINISLERALRYALYKAVYNEDSISFWVALRDNDVITGFDDDDNEILNLEGLTTSLSIEVMHFIDEPMHELRLLPLFPS